MAAASRTPSWLSGTPKVSADRGPRDAQDAVGEPEADEGEERDAEEHRASTTEGTHRSTTCTAWPSGSRLRKPRANPSSRPGVATGVAGAVAQAPARRARASAAASAVTSDVCQCV